MQIQIRTCNEKDASAIARLNIQWGYPATTEKILEKLAAVKSKKGNELFTAEINSEVIGWLYVYEHFSMGSDTYAEIGGLVVDEKHRQRGVARLLIENARQWAASRRLKSLKVRTNVKRPEASIVYERCGFTLLKQQHVFDMKP